MFIKLTDTNNKTLYVNMGKIDALIIDEQYFATRLLKMASDLSGFACAASVKETPEQILKMIKESKDV